jgi:hypothetical protein
VFGVVMFCEDEAVKNPKLFYSLQLGGFARLPKNLILGDPTPQPQTRDTTTPSRRNVQIIY